MTDDDKIIQFPTAEIGHLICTACGCQTWWVHEDSSLMCAGCDTVPTDHVRVTVPEAAPRQDAGEGEPTAWDNRLYHSCDGSFDMAQRRLGQRVMDGEFAAVVGVKADGGTHAVTAPGYAMDTPDRRRWLLRALRRAYELIVRGA